MTRPVRSGGLLFVGHELAGPREQVATPGHTPEQPLCKQLGSAVRLVRRHANACGACVKLPILFLQMRQWRVVLPLNNKAVRMPSCHNANRYCPRSNVHYGCQRALQAFDKAQATVAL